MRASGWLSMVMVLAACPQQSDDSGDGAGTSTAGGTATGATGASTTLGATATSASASADGSGGGSATGTGSADTGAVSVSGSGSATTAMTSDSTAGGTSGGCADPQVPNPEYICCDGQWVDPRSDQFHCGDCNTACGGDAPFCDQGTCGVPACADTTSCGAGEECCGTECCGAGMTCCTLNGPIMAGPGCVMLDDSGVCPQGCAPLCRCAAPDTPIATPSGDRSIASLVPGDLVFSVDEGVTTEVPILRVQRVPAENHHVVRAVLDDGQIVRISASHPLGDGRGFGDLAAGERFGEHTIAELEAVAYDEAFTYDILPDSSTGAYFVAGELVGTTMARELSAACR